MKHRRFIAGAVCPGCGAMDRLVLEGNGKERHCVACGYRDALPVAASPEPSTRLGRGGAKPGADAPRPVRILGRRPSDDAADEKPGGD
ncbi:MAG: YheV family putative metal-binding protein [Gammaproteobacteria bacterium]